MSEVKFVDGLRVFPPHERAPDFVKAQLVITRKALGNWLRGEPDDEIRIDVKESRNGKWYAAVNDYRPQRNSTGGQANGNTGGSAPHHSELYDRTGDDDYDDDIPF